VSIQYNAGVKIGIENWLLAISGSNENARNRPDMAESHLKYLFNEAKPESISEMAIIGGAEKRKWLQK